MTKKKSYFSLLVLVAIFAIGFALMATGVFSGFDPTSANLTSRSILHLKLDGIIMTRKSGNILRDLWKYGKKFKVHGVVIEVNSPGGVVGPSQEIYSEIVRFREETKKPVVVSSSTLLASGAYYIAVGADKVVVNPGTIVGSIGVIMEFANLERLMEWAKIERFVVKTGPYKDSGATYRPMRADEKEVFQEMIDDVFLQFKKAVADGRNLPLKKVEEVADGRIMSGERAMGLGLVDELGSFQSAVDMVAEIAGLGEDFQIFEPPKERPSIFDFLSADMEEEQASIVTRVEHWLGLELSAQPLYLLPGFLPRWGK
jgi:protease-4